MRELTKQQKDIVKKYKIKLHIEKFNFYHHAQCMHNLKSLRNNKMPWYYARKYCDDIIYAMQSTIYEHYNINRSNATLMLILANYKFNISMFTWSVDAKKQFYELYKKEFKILDKCNCMLTWRMMHEPADKPYEIIYS